MAEEHLLIYMKKKKTHCTAAVRRERWLERKNPILRSKQNGKVVKCLIRFCARSKEWRFLCDAVYALWLRKEEKKFLFDINLTDFRLVIFSSPTTRFLLLLCEPSMSYVDIFPFALVCHLFWVLNRTSISVACFGSIELDFIFTNILRWDD